MSAFVAFGGILALLLGVVVLSAIRERREDPREPEDPDPTARREAALAGLREVEFDYRTGKLPDGEYRRLRRAYGQEAVRARDEAAALGGEAGAPEATGAVPAAPGQPPAGDPGAGETECPGCGAPGGSDARFCASCGAPLRGPAA